MHPSETSSCAIYDSAAFFHSIDSRHSFPPASHSDSFPPASHSNSSPAPNSTYVRQGHTGVAFAAAAVYEAVLYGRAVPSTSAFFGGINLTQPVHAPPLTLSVLQRARQEGIIMLFSSA